MAWTLVALACIARFVHLDADPMIEHWVGYVTDEGRWVETARNLALFGEPRLNGLSKLHLVMSPAFQAANYVVFELFGVGFWSARLWSAASGAALVIVSFLLLRGIASGLPLFLGLAIVSFEPLVLSLSRTALPEIPALLFSLLAFIAIASRERPVRGAAIGGLLLALAISTKLTTVLLAPVFLLMVVLSGAREPARLRLLGCSAFLLGLLIPAALGLFLAIAAGIVRVEEASGLWRPFAKALEPASPYGIVARFTASPTEYGNVNLLLAGAWICSWMLAFRQEYRGTRQGLIFELSGVWAAGWFIVLGSLDYTPSRYAVHCILPLAIHVAAGLGLWSIIGPARVLARIGELRARWGVLLLGWLVLPTAVIAAALGLELASLAGLANERLAYRLLAIAATGVALSAIARAMRPAAAAGGFIAIAAAGILLEMTMDPAGGFAPSGTHAAPLVPVAEAILLAGAAGYFLAGRASVVALLERASAKMILGGLALVGLLLQSAPGLLWPTFSIREASREMERLFPGAVALRSVGAGSLFLETRLPYRDLSWEGIVVDGLVSHHGRFEPGPEFAPLTTFRLTVHPRYAIKGRALVESGATLVKVYRNTRAKPPQAVPEPTKVRK